MIGDCFPVCNQDYSKLHENFRRGGAGIDNKVISGVD